MREEKDLLRLSESLELAFFADKVLTTLIDIAKKGMVDDESLPILKEACEFMGKVNRGEDVFKADHLSESAIESAKMYKIAIDALFSHPVLIREREPNEIFNTIEGVMDSLQKKKIPSEDSLKESHLFFSWLARTTCNASSQLIRKDRYPEASKWIQVPS